MAAGWEFRASASCGDRHLSRGGNTTPLQGVWVVVRTRELAKVMYDISKEFRRCAVTSLISPTPAALAGGPPYLLPFRV